MFVGWLVHLDKENFMRKYILLFILLFCFGCEDSNELELIYSSITDEGIYDGNSGVLLKFSKEVSNDTFDAESVEKYNDLGLGIDVADTLDVDGTVSFDGIPDFMIFVKNSNFIKLNNQPLTFMYNSETHSCLLLPFTNELLPDGTGEGFVPNQVNNQLKVGDELIDFTFEQSNMFNVVPNPFKQTSSFSESSSIRSIRFTNLPDYAIIDIYQVGNDYYINRLIHNRSEDGNMWWDLRTFGNQYVSSGFYQYRIGADTLSNGYLNYSTIGYFGIAVEDN